MMTKGEEHAYSHDEDFVIYLTDVIYAVYVDHKKGPPYLARIFRDPVGRHDEGLYLGELTDDSDVMLASRVFQFVKENENAGYRT